MLPIYFGSYVLNPSLVEFYKIEKSGVIESGDKITLFLKNGTQITETIDDEDTLEEITDTLYDAMKNGE